MSRRRADSEPVERRVLHVRLPADEYDRLLRYAERRTLPGNDVNLSRVVRTIIAETLNRQEDGQGDMRV